VPRVKTTFVPDGIVIASVWPVSAFAATMAALRLHAPATCPEAHEVPELGSFTVSTTKVWNTVFLGAIRGLAERRAEPPAFSVRGAWLASPWVCTAGGLTACSVAVLALAGSAAAAIDGAATRAVPAMRTAMTVVRLALAARRQKNGR
jgi:hypothetical protein